MSLDRLDTIKQAVLKARHSDEDAVPPTLEQDMDSMCVVVFGGRELGEVELSCEM